MSLKDAWFQLVQNVELKKGFDSLKTLNYHEERFHVFLCLRFNLRARYTKALAAAGVVDFTRATLISSRF